MKIRKKFLYTLPRLVRMVISAAVPVIAAAYFAGYFAPERGSAHWQIVPLVLSNLAAFTLGGALMLGVMLISALLAGRFYCSLLCPLGIAQDIAALPMEILLRKRKIKFRPNPPFTVPLRLAAAGVIWVSAAGGSAFLLLHTDPYSLFGRGVSFVSYGASAAMGSILLLAALYRRRFFCNAFCPAGSLLGAMSKFTPLPLSIGEKCVKCQKCVTVCPAGAIDISRKHIDNSACLRCMECVAVCPVSAINFRLKKRETPVFDPERRRFILNVSLLAAGSAVALAAGKGVLALAAGAAEKLRFLPPGGGNAARFANRCTGCQLCVSSCPEHLIIPTPGAKGIVQLRLNERFCDYNCNRCMQVCPTGALVPHTLERKQQLQIALAKVELRYCLMAASEDELCGKCVAVCPVQAMTLDDDGLPQLNAARCIGCGKCRALCPARPEKAIRMVPVAEQKNLGFSKAKREKEPGKR